MKKISRAELNNAIVIDALDNVDINGGTIDGTVIGGASAAAGTFTTLTTSSTVTLNGGTANGITFLNGSKVLTTGSALTFNGSKLTLLSSGEQLKLESTGDFSSTGLGFLRFYDSGGAKGYLGYAGTASRMDLQTGIGMNFFLNATGGTAIFSVSNAERMRITSTGNVGIGTSSPRAILDLNTTRSQKIRFGTAGSIGETPVSAGDYIANNLIVSAEVGATITYTKITSDAGNAILQDFSRGITFYTGATGALDATGTLSTFERLRITSTGNVGIGTTSPANTLQVKSSANDNGITIQRNSTTTDDYAQLSFLVSTSDSITPQNWIRSFRVSTSSQGTMAFGTSGSERMRITSAGNVGIGTTSPGRLLTVSSSGSPLLSLVTTGTASCQLLFGDSDSDTIGKVVYSNTTDAMSFEANGAERARIDSSGNLLVGGTASPASATKSFALFNGTVPTGSVTDGCVLYTEDVSSSSELKVRDEAGNITTLSPHNFDLIPEGPSEDMAWSYYSERDGKRINVDMLKAIRLLEKLSGEQLVYESK
jgi:hypothetical protein